MNPVERVLVIGNSGAGKSHLAKALAARSNLSVFSLDDFHWLPGGFDRKRDPREARRLARDAAAAQSWIVEGVYGWLADEILPRAEALIWLDLNWDTCAKGLRARGDISRDHWLWAQDYWRRATSSSFAGHLALYSRFPGVKRRLASRAAIDALIDAQAISETRKTISI